MVTEGLRSGALLQRAEDNTCCTVIRGTFTGKPHISKGVLTPQTADTWQLTGLPTGGPYTLTISDEKNEQTFENLYVGDLWLLAGQSNMEGAGWVRPVDRKAAENPLPSVRALYMDDRWEAARPILHQLYLSQDPAHKKLGVPVPTEEVRRAVGPGYFFARALWEKTGIPQGVIATAVGGSPLDMWLPPENGEDNYYTAAARRVRLAGRRIRGMFWYQGEADVHRADTYCERFEKMRNGLAALCGLPELPTVTVQLFRCVLENYAEIERGNREWNDLRNVQWAMTHTQPMLGAVATNDLELDDQIHLSAGSQETLGYRAADAMLRLLSCGQAREPELDSVTLLPVPELVSGSVLRLTYRHVVGNLKAVGVPSGFSLALSAEAAPTQVKLMRTVVHGNNVDLRVEWERERLKNLYLWYGYGHHFYCNITDGAHHAIPSFGPLPLSAWLREI